MVAPHDVIAGIDNSVAVVISSYPGACDIGHYAREPRATRNSVGKLQVCVGSTESAGVECLSQRQRVSAGKCGATGAKEVFGKQSTRSTRVFIPTFGNGIARYGAGV